VWTYKIKSNDKAESKKEGKRTETVFFKESDKVDTKSMNSASNKSLDDAKENSLANAKKEGFVPVILKDGVVLDRENDCEVAPIKFETNENASLFFTDKISSSAGVLKTKSSKTG
jgi:hypothetical protein